MQCSLVNNSYQHASKVLFTFVPYKQFGQLINVAPHSLAILNPTNTELSSIEIWFTDQIGKQLQIKDIDNRILIIGKKKEKRRQTIGILRLF